MLDNSYFQENELVGLGFLEIGKNVKISRKASIYGCRNILLGDFVRIDDFSVISVGEQGVLDIGAFVHISTHCSITAGNSKVIIGSYSGMAANCHLYGSSDDYSGKSLIGPEVKHSYRSLDNSGIHMGEFCNLGTGTTVLPGVQIRVGTVLGANSLLLKDTLPWSIYFGTPAKFISNRNKDMALLAKLNSEYYEIQS